MEDQGKSRITIGFGCSCRIIAIERPSENVEQLKYSIAGGDSQSKESRPKRTS
jgi:hypothetical protein